MLCERYAIFLFILLANITTNKCNVHVGPDPWDYARNVHSATIDEDIPSDLRLMQQKKVQTNNNMATGEWFFKRILAIVLKGGQIKKNEDGSMDISLHMKYNEERWKILDDYIKSNTVLSEDMYRRSVGYIEEAIYKPTISERIVLAWSEYILYYLTEYKAQFVWATTILALVMTVFWLWNHISQKHVIILIITALYLYEVLISYKEAEKQEIDRFITAINTCKWYIWSSECEVPPPDPLIFMKHMNPLKIAIRMFTTLLSEPMITINETIKIMICGITDGFWFPFNKIMYGVLIVSFNVLFLFLLVMIIFNYILNIPLKLSLLGIVSICLKQRTRSMLNTNFNEPSNVPRVDNGDRISGENLSKLLQVYTHALNTAQSSEKPQRMLQENSNLVLTNKSKMSRSASTGRLPNYECGNSDLNENFNNNDIPRKYKLNGGGDAR